MVSVHRCSVFNPDVSSKRITQEYSSIPANGIQVFAAGFFYRVAVEEAAEGGGKEAALVGDEAGFAVEGLGR